MNKQWSDVIEVLSCDIASRPAAPGPYELLPFVTGVERDPDALRISFDPVALPVFEAFAAAERVCCSGIEWDLVSGDTLRIGAAPAALDELQRLFPLTNRSG